MRVLVVAKAPVAGQAKTRLGAVVGPLAAARIAAAALVDTLRVATAAAGASGCHLALAGDLDRAVDRDRIRGCSTAGPITTQRGADLSERLVNAHLDAGEGPVVQIGMDTPQVTPTLLAAAARPLDAPRHRARCGRRRRLVGAVPQQARRGAGAGRRPMSTPTTYADTRAALDRRRCLGRAEASGLRDVDTVADADAVALAAPDTEFARVWAAVR